MERFCDELRWEREQRNVSIETICAVTKVQPRYFQALEAGDYDNLPGGVFRRGILRGYLSVLGLDERVWMERFEANFASAGDVGASAEDWVEFAENVRKSRTQSRPQTGMRWLGVAGMFALVVLVGWLVWILVVHRRMESTQSPGNVGIQQRSAGAGTVSKASLSHSLID